MIEFRTTVAAAITAAALVSMHEVRAQSAFILSSASFKDGERLAIKNAGNNKSNPNCFGENISPPLSWTAPPDGTKSFALLMFDPDGHPPAGESHMVAYGIPASVTGFAEGELSRLGEKFIGGQSSMKLATYYGPCTPPGAPHHYTFTLIATDLEPSALRAGMARDEVIKALEGHAKVASSIIGTFSHP